MSKNKRSKKRERIPVIDTLIDLAGAMTLDYLAACILRRPVAAGAVASGH